MRVGTASENGLVKDRKSRSESLRRQPWRAAGGLVTSLAPLRPGIVQNRQDSLSVIFASIINAGPN